MTASAPLDLRHVQLVRKAVLFGAIIGVVTLAAVSHSLGGDTELHEWLEDIGLAAITVCIVGRAWCSLYIGGRKAVELVDQGPYSVSRNPLYVFSSVGAFGIGAQTGTLTLALLVALISVLVFQVTVRREEYWLSTAFAGAYDDYRHKVPRFWPDMTKWRDREVIEARPVFFLRTLRDGLAFLLAIPLFEAIETVQDIGWLAVLLRLP